MNLDEQLNELLAGLGVVREETSRPVGAHSATGATREPEPEEEVSEDEAMSDVPDEDALPSELCLFQTSREHYGVFYRLDLIDGAPQLRIFSPEESGTVKMRCYLVRAAPGSPLRSWFAATRAHGGSEAYDDARDTAQQHLLFAAGELMKRLFWTGEPEEERFPAEIEVRRLV